MATAEEYDPFFNVRKGGPKEKRIRRVELMGEHKPKPIYYAKVIQSLEDEFLSEDTLTEFFEARVGKIGDVYRPVDSAFMPKDFALVGFYDPLHVQAAIALLNGNSLIEGISVTAEEAKPWLLDLYPRNR
mmetsp:Transcript_21577/g.36129  ORF Transcript_21577/g.36129 Transcript_21577/m.36129 type:complete len:130 (-) Transcript_21577:108-497(-)|eukprot:CAMPEP_0174967138 /NCGR_PEP_ID=MMETSP0004_2-20121128/7419_1 /TAXON_ID=420556 /ORGANISM="Ochromonas sp., Strain CCMP1393" /LENGTH=129 /DNA_ID=CAMNT_0016216241 /DNA_START=173 /DNA_END=562 /DNA_ORIENTATION=+